MVWSLARPQDIVEYLASCSNPLGRIKNYDLEIAALLMQESFPPGIFLTHHWHTPTTGSDNTPTVSWNFCEYYHMNPVVVDMLHLRSIWNRNAIILPSVFYHLGLGNTIANDASQWFELFDLAFFPFLSPVTTQYSHQFLGPPVAHLYMQFHQ